MVRIKFFLNLVIGLFFIIVTAISIHTSLEHFFITFNNVVLAAAPTTPYSIIDNPQHGGRSILSDVTTATQYCYDDVIPVDATTRYSAGTINSDVGYNGTYASYTGGTWGVTGGSGVRVITQVKCSQPITPLQAGLVTTSKPPRATIVSAIATSTCAAEVTWTEPVTAPNPGTFTLNRIFSSPPSITGFDKIGSSTTELLSGSGAFSFVDKYYNWRESDLTLNNDPLVITPGFSMRYSLYSCDENVQNCSTESNRVTMNIGSLQFYSAAGKDPQSTTVRGNNGVHHIEFATSSPMSPNFMEYGGIRIERIPGGVTGGKYTGINYAGSGKYFFEESGVSNAVNYEYRISTFESDRYCDPNRFNNQASVSGVVTVMVPAAPEGVSATFFREAASTKVDLAWTYTHSIEDEFIIERSLNSPTGPFTEIGRVGTGITTYSDTTVDATNRKTYYYRVRAYDVSGGYSYYGEANIEVSPFAIEKLSAQVLNASTSTLDRTANILVQWVKHAQPTPLKPFLVTRTGGGISAKAFPPINTISAGQIPSVYDNDLPYSNVPYEYRVSWGTDVATTSLNLDLWRVLHGSAWGFARGGDTQAGIGWVNFNSTVLGKEYSVQMNRAGLLSGAAWVSVWQSHGYGWISFNENDLTECPDKNITSVIPGRNNCSAWFDAVTGQVRGWGRFYQNQSYETRDQTRWDGWISLSSTRVDGEIREAVVAMSPQTPFSTTLLALEVQKLKEHFTFRQAFTVVKLLPKSLYESAYAQVSPVTYGVTFNRSKKRFYGEAWGNNIAGWIAFTDPVNPANGAVAECGGVDALSKCQVSAYIINRPPVVDNVKIEEPTVQQIEPWSNRSGRAWCAEEPWYRVRFDYTDLDGVVPGPDSDFMKNVQIALMKPDGSGSVIQSYSAATGTQAIGPVKGAANSTQEYIGWFKDPFANTIEKDTSYKASVRAEDSEGAWSSTSTLVIDWALSTATTTPSYYYPLVKFSWDPAPAPIGRITNFSATSSENRSGSLASSSSWKYDWIFPHVTFPANNKATTSVVFNQQAVATDEIFLTIKDINNNECSAFETPISSATSTTEIKRKIKEQ
ncbi:MAG: hypothetical protein WCV80_02900 [Candidatus Paceibacterota bacterium]|jgi:hypothetical protein